MLHEEPHTNANEVVQQPALPPITEQDLIRLVNQLDSKDARKCAEAEQAIRSVGPGAISKLRSLATRVKRGFWFRLVGGNFLVVGIYFFVTFLMDQFGLNLNELASGLRWLIMFMELMFMGNIVSVSRLQRKIVKATSLLDDVRVVNLLLESLEYLDKHAGRTATEALIRLLPCLKSQDRDLLSRESRITLHQTVSNTKNKALTLAILAAWQQVGDKRELPYVRRLTKRKVRVGEEAITVAAQVCLQAIQQRIGQEHPQKILLRAAEPPSTDSGKLLRSAEQAQNPLDLQQLLRAGQGNIEDQEENS